MKIPAATLSEEEVFGRVAQAINHVSGVRLEEITPEARLREDLGVYGDDGDDILCLLDGQFLMDWEGIDPGVHFGVEGVGAPLPWLVKRSPDYFEPQPLRVAVLVDSLRVGRWPKSPRLPISASRRFRLHVASWLQFGLLVVPVVAVLAVWLFGTQ